MAICLIMTACWALARAAGSRKTLAIERGAAGCKPRPPLQAHTRLDRCSCRNGAGRHKPAGSACRPAPKGRDFEVSCSSPLLIGGHGGSCWRQRRCGLSQGVYIPHFQFLLGHYLSKYSRMRVTVKGAGSISSTPHSSASHHSSEVLVGLTSATGMGFPRRLNSSIKSLQLPSLRASSVMTTVSPGAEFQQSDRRLDAMHPLYSDGTRCHLLLNARFCAHNNDFPCRFFFSLHRLTVCVPLRVHRLSFDHKVAACTPGLP